MQGVRIALLTALIVCSVHAASGQEIRLADVVELSGTGASVGVNWAHGVDLAIEEINQHGGILGHRVAVEHYDTQSQPSIARAQILKALDQEPYAILGPIFSGSVKACMELSARAKVVQFVGAVASDLTQMGDNYLFRAGQNQRSSSSLLATYVQRDLKAASVSLVWINNDFGADARNLLRAAFGNRGMRILEDIAVEPGQLTFEAEIARLKAARSDVAVVTLNEEEAARFLRSAKKEGLTSTIVGGGSLLSAKVIELAGDSANGARGLLGLTPYAPVKELQEFGRKFKARFHSMPDHNAIEGSVAVYAIKAATQKIGGINRDLLAATLRGMTISPSEEPGILVKTTWDHDGDAHRLDFIGEIVNGRQKIVRVIDAVSP